MSSVVTPLPRGESMCEIDGGVAFLSNDGVVVVQGVKHRLI
jgi:hypothetical protein